MAHFKVHASPSPAVKVSMALFLLTFLTFGLPFVSSAPATVQVGPVTITVCTPSIIRVQAISSNPMPSAFTFDDFYSGKTHDNAVCMGGTRVSLPCPASINRQSGFSHVRVGGVTSAMPKSAKPSPPPKGYITLRYFYSEANQDHALAQNDTVLHRGMCLSIYSRKDSIYLTYAHREGEGGGEREWESMATMYIYNTNRPILTLSPNLHDYIANYLLCYLQVATGRPTQTSDQPPTWPPQAAPNTVFLCNYGGAPFERISRSPALQLASLMSKNGAASGGRRPIPRTPS